MSDTAEKIDKRPPYPALEWQWYSICSKHSEYDPECGLCNRGEWISDNEREFDNWLWTFDQDIWRKWANRNNVSGWREYFRKNKW